MSASELLAQLLENNRKGGGFVHASFSDFGDVGKDRTNITYGTKPAAQRNSSSHVPERSEVAPTGLDISHTHFGKVAGNNTKLDIPNVKDVNPQQLQPIVHPAPASTSVVRPPTAYNSQGPLPTNNFTKSHHLSATLNANSESSREKPKKKK